MSPAFATLSLFALSAASTVGPGVIEVQTVAGESGSLLTGAVLEWSVQGDRTRTRRVECTAGDCGHWLLSDVPQAAETLSVSLLRVRDGDGSCWDAWSGKAKLPSAAASRPEIAIKLTYSHALCK